MTPDELQARLDRFAVGVFTIAQPLLRRRDGQNAGRQLIKSSSSMAQNYAATRVSRSHKEFTAKIGVVREESQETLKWLRYLLDTKLATAVQLKHLLPEAGDLCAIMKASYRTAEAKENNSAKPKRPPGTRPQRKDRSGQIHQSDDP